MKIYLLAFLAGILLLCCGHEKEQKTPEVTSDLPVINETSLVILGTAQDGGSPHIGCEKTCCSLLFQHPDPDRKVVSLGLIAPKENKSYLFEATPDFTSQTKALQNLAGSAQKMPDGIFLTHAHIGHYTGLMYLGREALGADKVPVYTMPKMKNFLETNGPWSQLVFNKNIVIKSIFNRDTISITKDIKVVPLQVPHRDEYSETVGYVIIGSVKKALFIPDIDKWEKWETSITALISQVDYAFLDATFFDAAEVNHRDISEIPHPFVIESMKKFEELPSGEKEKIWFIHFNHTNPLLNPNSPQSKTVKEKGFQVATLNQVFKL